MASLEDLRKNVSNTFRTQWSTRDGRAVPAPENLKLGNDAVILSPATVLYADLDGSTNMVDTLTWQISAEIYKTFLHCASTLIKDEGGIITSYDGDRVMGIFLGDLQTSSAARCALKINYAVKNIINPEFKAFYTERNFDVVQVVGIDVSEIHAARTGVRGDNDIVWVGRAANYAAKLTSAGSNFRTWLTEAAFKRLSENSRYGGVDNQDMWTPRKWVPMNNAQIYGSNWTWKI